MARIDRRDTADNAKNIQGSVVPDGDRTTPVVEAEEDVEVDEEG